VETAACTFGLELLPQTLEAGLLFSTPVAVVNRMPLRPSPDGASHARQRTEEHRLLNPARARARRADRLEAQA